MVSSFDTKFWLIFGIEKLQLNIVPAILKDDLQTNIPEVGAVTHPESISIASIESCKIRSP